MQGITPSSPTHKRPVSPGSSVGRYIIPGLDKIEPEALAEFKQIKTDEGARALIEYLRDNQATLQNKDLVLQFCRVHGKVLDQELLTKFGGDPIVESALFGIKVGLLGKIKEAAQRI